MCGIWALFGYDGSDVQRFASAFKIGHRGPDCFHLQNIEKVRNCSMAFHRLCVVDSVRGMQPMRLTQYPHLTLICNGEIYNFKTLKGEFDFQFETACDIEIILHLYEKFGIEKTAQLLDGVFAFLILDTRDMKLMLARDSYGVRPLFYFLAASDGILGLCSESKGLVDILRSGNDENKTEMLQAFPPGHYMVFNITKNGKVDFVQQTMFHSFVDRPLHWQYQGIELLQDDDIASVQSNIRCLFTNAVEKRLMTSRRVGCLLSGGLDSSLVAAVTAEKLKERQCKQPLQTFSIGFDRSPDVLAARKVAKHIGSEHHEVIITPQQALDAVDDVIYAVESFDVTTIRASTPMYLLSKYINQNTDTIVIMSGEGADELGQGYIYFHKQPNAEEGDKESRRLLKDLYMYDVLRSDRSTAAHGLEVRVPFLDHALTSYYLSLPSKLRVPTNGIEKYLIRSSFDNIDLIPKEILWRKKEAFSDGIASIKKSWFSYLQEHIESKITDEDLANAAVRHPHCPPQTKEGLYYREVFEKKYSKKMSQLIPYIWLPRWMDDCSDPSARVLSHYENDETVKENVA